MAKKSNNMAMVGKVAFFVGLILAVVAGLSGTVADYAYTPFILVVLGLVVGFLNVAEKDVMKLLVALLTLIAVSVLAVNASMGVIGSLELVFRGYLTPVLQHFVAFMGAVALVVALKAVIETTKK
jgi:hypothetical protein